MQDNRRADRVPSEMPERRSIAVDFDGVIHAYTSGWRVDEQGHGCIDDDPVPGAIEWLSEIVQHYDVWIFSCRMLDSRRSHVERRMRRWLYRHGASESLVDALHFTHEKPHADVYLDDRGLRFEGTFPSLETIRAAATPWNKRATSG